MTTIERDDLEPSQWKEKTYTAPDCFIKVRANGKEILVVYSKTVPALPPPKVEREVKLNWPIKLQFPVVRRVAPDLMAQDIIKVQPISLLSGLLFFLEFTENSK